MSGNSFVSAACLVGSDAALIAVGAQRTQIEEVTEQALVLVRTAHNVSALRIMSDRDLAQVTEEAAMVFLPQGAPADVVDRVSKNAMLAICRGERAAFDVV